MRPVGRQLKLFEWLPVSEAQVLRALAERIKSLRRSKRWSQEQLAERASMQRSYLADLERGYRNPSVRTLLKVANAIGVPISSLFVENTKSRRSTRRARL
jgi:transcriptional regulator with XRE-family HTH domain